MPDQAIFALHPDNPIETAADDTFRRAPYAKHIAEQIQASEVRESYVIGIQGPWGSGKTSLLNMIAEEVNKNVIILRFNPWLINNQEQLLSHFFRELSSQLFTTRDEKLRDIATGISKYASMLNPLAGVIPTWGGWVQLGLDLAKNIASLFSHPQSLEKQRETLKSKFKALNSKILIIIDDLDRMPKDEVRELVRLVRLVGDFPNVIYIVAYDSDRIAKALQDDDINGRAYIEKIVQITYDLPTIQPSDLFKICLQKLELITQTAKTREIDQDTWPLIWHNIISPLIKTPRDVIRYTNALPVTLRSIGREVALADTLALEAIRVLKPKLFQKIILAKTLLTSHSDRPYNNNDDLKQKVDDIFNDEDLSKEYVHDVIKNIFPFAAKLIGGTHYSDGHYQKWSKDRRVAVPVPLAYYLEHALHEGDISTSLVESALALFQHHNMLESFLCDIKNDELENLLERLTQYEDSFPRDNIENASIVFLNQYPRLKRGKRGFYDLGGHSSLSRLIYRLIKQMYPEPNFRERLNHIFIHTNWINAKDRLVNICKTHDFIDNDLYLELCTEIKNQIKTASNEQLTHECNLYELIRYHLWESKDDIQIIKKALSNDDVLISFLDSARQEGATMDMQTGKTNITATLPWTSITSVIDATSIRERLLTIMTSSLFSALCQSKQSAMELALRYAGGWRPDGLFGKDDQQQGSIHPSAVEAIPEDEDKLGTAPLIPRS